MKHRWRPCCIKPLLPMTMALALLLPLALSKGQESESIASIRGVQPATKSNPAPQDDNGPSPSAPVGERDRRPRGRVKKESRNELPSRLKRRLLEGDTQAKLQVIEAIRLRFLNSPEAHQLLAAAADAQLASTMVPDHFVMMIAETFASAAPSDVTRESLLRWLDLALSQPPDEGNVIGNWSQLAFTLLIGLQNHDHPDVHAMALQLLNARDERVQILVFDLLGIQQHEPAIEPLIGKFNGVRFQLSYPYRFALLNAISRFDDPRVITALRLRLPTLTGQLHALVKFRLQAEENQRAKKLPAQIVVEHRPLRANSDTDAEPQEDTGPARYRLPPEKRTKRKQVYHSPSFFGLPLYADRITFVIDFSGTMRSRTGSGISRLALAKRELVKAIGQLQPHQSFRVIGFDTNVVSLSPTLVEAIPTEKTKLTRQLGLLNNGSGTNLYGGLTSAIMDPGSPELIVLLSDGMPSSGEIQAPNLILKAVDVQNLFRRITISTITIGRPNPLMTELARRNGGANRHVK